MAKKEKNVQVYKPKVGDIIICEHKGYHYKAKVLQMRKKPDSNDKNPEMQYLVHYQGWNKNWDEWAGEDRILQYNDDNIAIMKSSKETGSARKKLATQQQKKEKSVAPPTTTVVEPMVVEPEELPQAEVKIKVPEELKNWLIDDENCIKEKKLTVLPAKTTISIFLKDFVAHKKTGDKEFLFNELTLGIRDYFNVMLGSFLLYKFERPQYQSLLKEHGKDVDLTNHYGIIHLLRLFTKIGKYLAVSTLDPQNVQTIVTFIQDLMKFMSKRTSLFDLDKNYSIAPPDYIKNALK